MPRSKPGALPLGDAPKSAEIIVLLLTGVKINYIKLRWHEICNVLSKHRAANKFTIFRFLDIYVVKWQGRLDSNQRMPRSKPGALPLGDAPISQRYNNPN